jgi:flagellar basal-body rod modification protein FlgD
MDANSITSSSIDTLTNTKSTTSTSDGTIGLADTFDDFLILLTTQLQNQDPTDPMDANQFTQQLVDFAGVEQTVASNTKLDELIALAQISNSTDSILSSSALIGKNVESNGDGIKLRDGEVNFSYTLPNDTVQSNIEISNSNGSLVYSSTGKTSEGKYTFYWDGQDNAGNQLSDGDYTIKVSALDENNNTLAVNTHVQGVVTGVLSGIDEALLIIDGAEIPISQVSAVYENNEEAEASDDSDDDSDDDS